MFKVITFCDFFGHTGRVYQVFGYQMEAEVFGMVVMAMAILAFILIWAIVGTFINYAVDKRVEERMSEDADE